MVIFFLAISTNRRTFVRWFFGRRVGSCFNGKYLNAMKYTRRVLILPFSSCIFRFRTVLRQGFRKCYKSNSNNKLEGVNISSALPTSTKEKKVKIYISTWFFLEVSMKIQFIRVFKNNESLNSHGREGVSTERAKTSYERTKQTSTSIFVIMYRVSCSVLIRS